MRYILMIVFLASSLIGYSQVKSDREKEPGRTASGSDSCNKQVLACKLTSPEMQKRKSTIITSLKKQALEIVELNIGYSYRFAGTDSMLDELNDFVKTERLCCCFFDFELRVSCSDSDTWLTITGPEGAKEFIKKELDLY